MSKVADGSNGNVQKIETYDEFFKYLAGFRDGHFNLLVLIGGSGIGKSRLVREIIDESAAWIEGTSTAFGIYSALFEYRDRPIVIDDVDSIYSDRHCVSILKSICGTEPTKNVRWNARASFLEREGLPTEFVTSSRIMIISNEWKTLNRNVAALEDRGIVIHFGPSPREIHAKAGEWFGDLEIYDWFGSQLNRIETHSFRYYVKSAQLKASGIPWKRIIPSGRGKGYRQTLAKSLLADDSFETNEDRAKEFTRRGGGSRGTFFNYKRRIESER